MGKVFTIGERHTQEGNAYRERQLEKERAKLGKPLSGYPNIKKKKPKYHKTVTTYKEPPPYKPGMGSDFYLTREWRSLRFRVLREDGAICRLCNQSPQTGHVMHVDHIKPRAAYPELELTRENMQVLCEDCNLGKGAQTFKA